MAHITSNCLYLDQQEGGGGQHQNRTYEVIEVDRETRRKDCKVCLYSLGLICSLVIIAMISFNIIQFSDIKNNLFSNLVRYTCYFILFVATILFIYAIAKADFRVKSKPPNEYNENKNNYDLEKQCSFNDGGQSY